eukprot:UN26208
MKFKRRLEVSRQRLGTVWNDVDLKIKIAYLEYEYLEGISDRKKFIKKFTEEINRIDNIYKKLRSYINAEIEKDLTKAEQRNLCFLCSEALEFCHMNYAGFVKIQKKYNKRKVKNDEYVYVWEPLEDAAFRTELEIETIILQLQYKIHDCLWPELIIFDKDGTLIDFNKSWGTWLLNFNKAFENISGISNLEKFTCDVFGFDRENFCLYGEGSLLAWAT